MSKFKSKCGYVMVMQTDDDPYEYSILQDNIWIDKYVDFVESLPRTIDRKTNENDSLDDLYSLLLDTSVPMLKCPECGRIYIDFKKNNNFVIYKPEVW